MPANAQTLPGLHQPADFVFKSMTRTKTTMVESGKMLTRTYGGQWYELRLTWPPMTKEEFGPIAAFIEKQAGKNGIFYVEVPPMTGEEGEVVGNMANYANDTKLHRITDTGPHEVYPEARNGGGFLETGSVYMRCSLKNDVHQTQHKKDGFVHFELDLMERL
ncbi:MAG: hypothetical protein JKY34_07295 [Kordiimonadaceae bacterium]|nr:hypothetical protein [Kordiimonadaceae bacterium]